MNFIKMHGLGNDFVIIDAQSIPFGLSNREIAAIGDRRTGVGFDQMLVIETAKHPQAHLSYRIYNTDGSEAEQCGNGARCVARYYGDKHQLTSITMDSPGGLLTADKVGSQVCLDMGEPDFEPASLPMLRDTISDRYHARSPTGELEFSAVSMGNPHAVVEVEDVQHAPVQEQGTWLGAQTSLFPQGVNVGFMQVINREKLLLRVFERGVGETRACGTGACAAAAVARKLNLIDNSTTVQLPGGDLLLEWSGPGSHLLMTGPAEYVFEGKLYQ